MGVGRGSWQWGWRGYCGGMGCGDAWGLCALVAGTGLVEGCGND